MRKVRVTTGIACLMAFILCFVIFGANLAMSYDTVVNGMLGVQTEAAVIIMAKLAISTRKR